MIYKSRTYKFESYPYYYLIKLCNKEAKRVIENIVNQIEDINSTKYRINNNSMPFPLRIMKKR